MSITPILFQSPTSSASWRVRIALTIKGISYETKWLNLQNNEHLSKSYSEITPTQQVPCFEVDGQRLFQSVAIIEYLEETYPQPPLLPKDSVARAKVRGLTEIMNSLIQPMHNYAVRVYLEDEFNATEAIKNEWCSYWIERRLAGLEKALDTTHGDYCYGNQITIADLFLFPQVETSKRFKTDLSKFKNVLAIMDNLSTHPAFSGSYAQKE